MVVRFVCVVRVPLCVRVSRVSRVCVPAPPGVFLPVQYSRLLGLGAVWKTCKLPRIDAWAVADALITFGDYDFDGSMWLGRL
jgi:hypothetical protein